MNDFLVVFFGITTIFVLGILFALILSHFFNDNKLPYTWTCYEGDCSYSCESNSIEMINELASVHEEYHGNK